VLSVAAGSNLLNATATLQTSRPWHTDGKSNKCADNALTMDDIFKGRKVVLFFVPAPFTGTCTNAHVPGFVKFVPEFKAKGVDEIICCSVADPYAQFNWAQKMGVNLDDISFLVDWDASFCREHDLLSDYSETGLGVRSKRASMVVQDGLVKSFQFVQDAENDGQVCLDQC